MISNLLIPSLAIATFVFSALITWLLIGFLRRRGVIDIPNERSSHAIPTPRGGGLAIIISFLLASLALLFFRPIESFPGFFFWSGLILVAITSLLDDHLNLPVYIRFGLHLAAATMVSLENGGFGNFPLPEPYNFELGFFNYPLTIFWILAVLNIYNFLDGIDGYAAVQGLVASIGLALLYPAGVSFDLAIILAAAIAGFLLFNWHPARIFMGDIGSTSLGFIFATLPFYIDQVPVNLAIFSSGIFLWFFLADGAFTIVRRLLNKEKIWVAHRSHIYQRLVIQGHSHAKVTSSIMVTGLVVSLFHLYLYHYQLPNLIISLFLAITFFILIVFIEKFAR